MAGKGVLDCDPAQAEDTVTVGREELRAMLAEAAREGAAAALQEREEIEKAALEVADAKAARLEGDWRAQVAEMAIVKVVPDRDRTLSINGHAIAVKGGEEVALPCAYADLLVQGQEDEARVAALEAAMQRKYAALRAAGG